MNWYVAKIIFRIANTGAQRPQFDEHLRLVAAQNFEEAFLKARIIGIQEEDSFMNDKQQPVKWEFINVADLYPVSRLADGAELYSHIHETDEAADYIRQVHQRAVSMQTQEQSVI
jgi:hypothetical protein